MTVYNGNVISPTQRLVNGDIIEYTFSGSLKNIILKQGTYKFECYGSASSDVSGTSGTDNRGGYAGGTILITEDKEFFIVVGGNTSGNFNGSANGARGGVYSGGGTDIRLTGGNWNDLASLCSRIIVAGGGGTRGASNKYGGYGGGLTGQSRTENYGSYGEGGSQTGSGTYGGFGYGGAGQYRSNGYGGAGGGGYYGGGGVYPDRSGDDDRGGGGGSGFISGLAGCNAVISQTNSGASGQPNHYSGLKFTNASMQNGIRDTTGLVRITVIELVPQYIITATSNNNGLISPSGSIEVNYGESQNFTMIPNMGYKVLDVTVDGVSQGKITSYTFTNIAANHTISVTFESIIYTITSSVVGNGQIMPLGTTNVDYGGTQSYTIIADEGYRINDVVVDGVSMGRMNTYTFTNVLSDHNISVEFVLFSNIKLGTNMVNNMKIGAVKVKYVYLGSTMIANYVVPLIWSDVNALNYTFQDVNNLNLTWQDVNDGKL